jgi:glutathione peroxidase
MGPPENSMTTLYDFSHRSIDGDDVNLKSYAGKALLIVNVASKCGLTPQYEGLEALYRKHKDAGLMVLGFPCDQFMGQEPGTEAEIKDFCSSTYDVTFPLSSKVEVNGDARHGLYAHLTGLDTKPEGAGDISWNFEKFLVGKDGKVVARFGPRTAPDDADLVAAVEGAL